jgi:hypothetical protein
MFQTDQTSEEISEEVSEVLPHRPWYRRKTFWVMVVLVLGVLCLLRLALGQMLSEVLFAPWGKEMTLAYHTPQDVIGDLGGMPVKIPAHAAHWVQYDGDESWKPRKGPVPVRTYQSKLASFGMDARYPDMATLSSPELEKDKKDLFTKTIG